MIAAALALVSALSFATSTVVQHRAATECSVTPGHGRALRLVGRLVRSPAWLAGQATALAGFVLHGTALRAGPVVLVQPLLSCGLVLTLVLGALVDRRHPGRPLPSRRQWLAAAVVVVGLMVFLRSAHPGRGRPTGRWWVLAAGVAAVLVIAGIAAAWSRVPGRRHRAVALGLAAGVGFGMTGVLLKQVVHHLPVSWPTTWPLLALLLCGGTAIVCAQSAYQSGPLIESLPCLTVLEPVVAVVVASRAYGEGLHPGWLNHTGQVVGLGLLALGVIGIARAEAGRHTPLTEPVDADEPSSRVEHHRAA